ncbi:MAG: SDR family oxidoreductase [Candidatus Staskawiczbacteria bacterium]|nr:SDR family oxidoreductase [Candidatus Staskawiczbacteria bacterium]
MKKYLVTGGAGFIGSNIVKKILANGDFARVVDNLSTGRRENIEEFFTNPHFEFMEGDLIDMQVAKDAVKGMDFVLHQAAIPSVQRSVEDPLKSHDTNSNGTLNMLIAARDEKIKRFVYAASSSVYGENPDLPKKEDMPVMPISPYALQKYTGERYCQIFFKLYGLPTVCLRYFNIFGPKQDLRSQYSAVIPMFINALLNGKAPVVYGDGQQSRDFTFIDNVISANLLAVESEKGFGEVFNIGCGGQISLNQLLEDIKDILKVDTKTDYQTGRVGDVSHSRADISKAEKILGYKPVVSFREGLTKTIEWYQKKK